MKGLLFDMDGTLLDSMEIWIDLAENYLKTFDIDIPREVNEETKLMSSREALEHFNSVFNLGKDIDTMVQDVYKFLHKEYIKKASIKNNVKEILELLKAEGYHMAISTATDDEVAQPVLEHFEIIQYIKFLQTAKSTGIMKHDKGFWLHGAKLLKRKPEDIIVFEDALYAAKTAKEAGMKVIGIKDESMAKDQEKLKIVVDIYIEDWSEFDIKMLG